MKQRIFAALLSLTTLASGPVVSQSLEDIVGEAGTLLGQAIECAHPDALTFSGCIDLYIDETCPAAGGSACVSAAQALGDATDSAMAEETEHDCAEVTERLEANTVWQACSLSGQ